MKKKVVVLGAGLVGKVMAMDLSQSYQVLAVDLNTQSLESINTGKNIQINQVDITNKQKLQKVIEPADLVVGALPGSLGFKAAKTVIESGKDMVDISFFPEDPFELDELAKQKGVALVVDCGVAPGLGNLILGYHYHRMEVSDFECLVGGLPVVREWPYQYKAVFSPRDVIEEYTRTARYVQSGQLVEREALSDTELIDFEEVGTLEAWNSDGLRTLLHTVKVPNMIEKTLRYPGTTEYIKVLRETGFFSKKEMEVKGVQVKPLDLTAQLLFPLWQLKPGEEDFTVMRIKIKGLENGRPMDFTYFLYDRFDRSQNITSMARTTGFTCTAVANQFLEGKISAKGVIPPEYLGEDGDLYQDILNYLKQRNVVLKVTG